MKKIIDMLKSMTNSKKKVFALALSVCVVVLSIASSSIAYFTDTDTYTNVFTSGNVDIVLNGSNGNEGIYPGKTVTRNTTIDNVGTIDAYIGAVITLSSANIGAHLTADDEDTSKTYVGDFLTGLASGYVIKEEKSGETVTAFKVYIVYTEKLAKATNGLEVFTGMQIPTAWNNTEMASISNLNLTVDAYAVQTDGFASALAALQAAFDAFDGLS